MNFPGRITHLILFPLLAVLGISMDGPRNLTCKYHITRNKISVIGKSITTNTVNNFFCQWQLTINTQIQNYHDNPNFEITNIWVLYNKLVVRTDFN